jgi:hypothetical protein
MSDRHERYAAATGIFFVVLIVVAFLVQPSRRQATRPRPKSCPTSPTTKTRFT